MNAIALLSEGAGAKGLITEQIVNAFTDGIATIQLDATTMLVTALPVALGIMGLYWVVRKGVGFFKSVV